MRNMFLIGASVLALGISSAAAQQTTTVNDDSEGSKNVIEQTAAGTNSMIDVEQKGNGEDAPNFGSAAANVNVYIDQDSTADSTIMVEQNGQSGSVGNSVSILQTVTATNAANGSDVDTFQRGEGNRAAITQTANRADIDLDQDGTDNRATITQTANGTMAVVNQKGIDNIAVVEQMAIDGVVHVMQNGDDNKATAIQMATAVADMITINQTGNNGDTSVTQN